MFSKITKAALSIAFLLGTALPATAEGLDLPQIKAVWGGMSDLRAKFTQVHDKAYLSEGVVWVADPTFMIFTYQDTTGQITDIWVVNGSNESVPMPDWKVVVPPNSSLLYDSDVGNWNTAELGSFGRLLKKSPQIDEAFSGTGTNARHTVVRLRDPMNRESGCAQIKFDNDTGLMVNWSIYDTAELEQCGQEEFLTVSTNFTFID